MLISDHSWMGEFEHMSTIFCFDNIHTKNVAFCICFIQILLNETFLCCQYLYTKGKQGQGAVLYATNPEILSNCHFYLTVFRRVLMKIISRRVKIYWQRASIILFHLWLILNSTIMWHALRIDAGPSTHLRQFTTELFDETCAKCNRTSRCVSYKRVLSWTSSWEFNDDPHQHLNTFSADINCDLQYRCDSCGRDDSQGRRLVDGTSPACFRFESTAAKLYLQGASVHSSLSKWGTSVAAVDAMEKVSLWVSPRFPRLRLPDLPACGQIIGRRGLL